MASLEGCELQIRSYDTDAYKFRASLARGLCEQYMPGVAWESEEPGRLENLHELHGWLGSIGVEEEAELSQVKTRETDQQAQYYKDMYSLVFHPMRPAFRLGYLDFMEHEVQPFFGGEPLVYQTVPTLRAHLPGNVAVGEYHTDAKYGHPPEAVNFWVPATDAFGSNSLYIQTSEDEIPRSRNVKYGEYLIFDGVRLPHGNEINTTKQTRVSFDFRVIPKSEFKPSDKQSINTGLAFRTGEGGYYSLLTNETAEELRANILEEARPSLEWEQRLKAAWARNSERPYRPPGDESWILAKSVLRSLRTRW